MEHCFDRIIGNGSMKALLSSHIKNKTLSHAYIIEGPKGSGKKTIAKELCKALCCSEKDTSLFPCNHCRNCNRIEEGLNTDIMTVNRGDKASIQVEEVRALCQTMGYYPDDGDFKVYIIEEADKMTVAAQNALLLSLEEPPSYVVFLLLTEDSSFLLETVRSRAQTLKTELFSTSKVAEWLRDHPQCKKFDETDIITAASVSRGSLGTALSVLCDKGSKSAELSQNARKLVELLCTDKRSEAIIFASGIKYSRVEFEEFFDHAIFALRDLLATKFNTNDTLYYADVESAADLASKQKLSKLTKIYDALVCAKDDIIKNNAQIYAVMTTLAAQSV